MCIAPRSELVLQNSARYKALGLQCSIYSASAGKKSLRHPVVFATPMTFRGVAKRLGHEFAAVIIDECEGTTPTIISSAINGNGKINGNSPASTVKSTSPAKMLPSGLLGTGPG